MVVLLEDRIEEGLVVLGRVLGLHPTDLATAKYSGGGGGGDGGRVGKHVQEVGPEIPPPSVLDELLYTAFEDRHQRTVEALIQCQVNRDVEENGERRGPAEQIESEVAARVAFEHDVERVLVLQGYLDDTLRRQAQSQAQPSHPRPNVGNLDLEHHALLINQ